MNDRIYALTLLLYLMVFLILLFTLLLMIIPGGRDALSIVLHSFP